METEKNNPKALNLDSLEGVKHKVTLGFTCSPQVKLELAQEAKQLDITLSEHVEHLVMNRQSLHLSAKEEIGKLTALLNEHKGTIQFYENPFLHQLHIRYKGKTQEYTDSSGKKHRIEIKSIRDIYTVMINSFKAKP